MRANSKLTKAVKEAKKEEADDSKSMLIHRGLEKIFEPNLMEEHLERTGIFQRARVARGRNGVNRPPTTLQTFSRLPNLAKDRGV